jgi:two-component system cell cycle response regulator CtrA
MVLDPEPVVRRAMSAILERAGYTVHVTSAVGEALEILALSPPDLILTNVFLREMSGHDAIREIRSRCPDLPVLMVSGLPDNDIIHHWMNEDGFDTFPKPFTAGQLVAKVRQILRH